MTCYTNCLHSDVCKCADGVEYKDCENMKADCPHFKNKADFVEVVRCSKCKYKDDCAGQIVHTTRDYVLEQNISTYNKVDFCSYGERKNDSKE